MYGRSRGKAVGMRELKRIYSRRYVQDLVRVPIVIAASRLFDAAAYID